jgi:hypothetical protein
VEQSHESRFDEEFMQSASALQWFENFTDTICQYLDEPNQPTPQTPEWEALDFVGKKRCALDLSRTFHLESYIDYEQISDVTARSGLSPKSREHLQAVVGDYHNALPLSLPELYWLMNVYSWTELDLGLDADTLDDAGILERVMDEDTRPSLELDCFSPVVAAVIAKSGEVVSGGKRQMVSGADLVHRWWAWRRGVGDFEGVGTNDLARTTLRGLATLIGRPVTANIDH